MMKIVVDKVQIHDEEIWGEDMQSTKYQIFWKRDSFLLIKLFILFIYFGFYWVFTF